VTVDTVAPTAPVITGDAIVNTNEIMLTGTAVDQGIAEAGDLIKIYDGPTLVGTTTTNATGAWTYTTGPLPAGAHAFAVTVTDVAGNVSGGSNVDPVIGPAAPTIASFSPDSHIVGGINLANILTLTGSAEANSKVNVFDGTANIGSATTNGSGAWSFVTAPLANGSHTFTATDTDSTGTSAASAGLHVTVDAPALTVAFTYLQNWNGTVALAGTAEAESTIAIYDGSNSAPLGTVTAGSNGFWSFTSVEPASNTVHNFTATAMDAAGNTGASSGVAVLGTQGIDQLSAPSGNDLFNGNGGADTFVFAANFGHDTIMNFVGQGHDVIQFSTSTFNSFASVLANAAQVGETVVIHDAAGDTLTLNNVKLSSLQSADFHFA
jgi:hypothetical protein